VLSVIVPVLNEAANLGALLPHLAARCPDAEVLVVDGGSHDESRAVVATVPRVRGVTADRGRARQMNAGARAATGDVLLFLHADTRLPEGAAAAIGAALADLRVVGGRFDVRFDSPRRALAVVAAFMNARSRASGICTGDQALFVRRDVFEALGGYPDIPLMEDVELTRRLKRLGRLACLRLRVTTSGRKWEREGVLRTIGLMWGLRFLYFCGVSPHRLHDWYYPTAALALLAAAVLTLPAVASPERRLVERAGLLGELDRGGRREGLVHGVRMVARQD
jgi:rSAM/selenodomain-associated transferase 2